MRLLQILHMTIQIHADGSPTELDLNLTFTEYKPLNRDDVRNEDNDIFYNYEGFYRPSC